MKLSAFVLAAAITAVGNLVGAHDGEFKGRFAYSDGDAAQIEELLESNSVVFVPQENKAHENGNSVFVIDNYSNNAELAYDYYFKAKGKTVKGEIYKTARDTGETLQTLKSEIVSEVESGAAAASYNLDGLHMGSFVFGDAFISVYDYSQKRTANAIFKDNNMGTMTDYENCFILNNPDSSRLYMIITHETYLSPTQTKNRNFKGVGVEMKLSLNSLSDYCFVRSYAPTAQSPGKTVSYNGGFTGTYGTEDKSLSANFGFSYTKNVESPKILSHGSMPCSVDIEFAYVDPGSWYGDFCEYNSGETNQCACVVLEISKDLPGFSYNSSVTGRFQKYQNWPFPWVDEYYTINMDNNYQMSALLDKIAAANN